MNKLYVWEDFRCDWTCGIAFALAETKEEAIELIALHYDSSNRGNPRKSVKGTLNSYEPNVFDITEKVGFGISGGS